MFKRFVNEGKRLGVIELIYDWRRGIKMRLSDKIQEQIKIKKLKKLLKVNHSKIKEWKKSGKLKTLLDELEIIEFYIQLQQSIKEDEEYENQTEDADTFPVSTTIYKENPLEDIFIKILMVYYIIVWCFGIIALVYLI